MNKLVLAALKVYNDIMYPDDEPVEQTKMLNEPVNITRREYRALLEFRKKVIFDNEAPEE